MTGAEFLVLLPRLMEIGLGITERVAMTRAGKKSKDDLTFEELEQASESINPRDVDLSIAIGQDRAKKEKQP